MKHFQRIVTFKVFIYSSNENRILKYQIDSFVHVCGLTIDSRAGISSSECMHGDIWKCVCVCAILLERLIVRALDCVVIRACVHAQNNQPQLIALSVI